MIRVLHLRPLHADLQTESAVHHLCGDASGATTAEVRTIGRGGTYATPLLATLGLRRGSRGFDLVHAWGEPALTAAAFATGAPLVYSPVGFPPARSIGWVRAAIGYRDLQVVCSTDTMRRAFVERGVPIARCHLIRPGVDFSRLKRRRDDALRSALGFTPDDYVLLASGESTREAGHRESVWTAGVLHVLDRRHKLLMWGRGPLADAAARLAERFGQPGVLAGAERKLRRPVAYEQLMAAADCILITASSPVPTLPISIAMAAALPIVSTVTPTVAELLEDRHTALMVPRPAPRLLAQRVLDLREDPALQWAISDRARTEAYEFFALTRFLRQWRTVYQQIAEGSPVDLPPVAAGAGSRFHGRT